MLSRMLTLPLILSALILHLEWIFADQTAGATCKDNAALLDRIFDLNARIQQEQMKIMRLEKQLSAPQPSTPQPRNLTNLESFIIQRAGEIPVVVCDDSDCIPAVLYAIVKHIE